MLRHDLEHMYFQTFPLRLRTDSKQMFDVVSKTSSPSERRLMIDIAAACEPYNLNDIINVGLLRSEHNAADRLNKPKFCRALDKIVRTGVDKTQSSNV